MRILGSTTGVRPWPQHHRLEDGARGLVIDTHEEALRDICTALTREYFRQGRYDDAAGERCGVLVGDAAMLGTSESRAVLGLSEADPRVGQERTRDRPTRPSSNVGMGGPVDAPQRGGFDASGSREPLRYIQIRAARMMDAEESSPVHARLVSAQMLASGAQLAHELRGRVVGWWHTHPGMPLYLSDRDLRSHYAVFGEPWHVALVIDPCSQEAAYFACERDGSIRPEVPVAGSFGISIPTREPPDCRFNHQGDID